MTFNYVLHLLGAKSLTALSEDLKDPIYEGVDENGISRLYYAMRDHLHNGEVTTDDLLEYDHHIVKLTNEINEKRRDKIVWKYFQYLSLLFTEIYLDRYFRNKQALVADLNNFLFSNFLQREGVWEGVPDFTEEDLDNDKKEEKFQKQNTVVNQNIERKNSISSSDSDSSPQDNSDDEKKEEITRKYRNKNINKKLKTSIASDTSIENLMVKENLSIKVTTLVSSLICVATIGINIIWSLMHDKLTLTFSYGKDNNDQRLEEILMNYTMIYILLSVIIVFNVGLFICILIGNDHMLTKLIYTDLNWYFILTQLALGFQFLITIIWKIDLWTINVCLSVSMLAILILSFYFSEIKQKKNMSIPTFIFIYIYISVLFSFIAYLILFNISCILMENIGGENGKQNSSNTLKIVIKIGINAIQTILSFVLLTYYKDVFFSFTSGYIESAVFVHINTKFEGENIVLLVLVCAIALGIILTILRYRKKTFGYEDIILL